MTGKILDIFRLKVDCDTENCSVRYYLNDGELAMGIIRFVHKRKDGRIPQDVLTISSMDLDGMVGYLMATNDFPMEFGETLVNIIRNHATDKIKDIVRVISC